MPDPKIHKNPTTSKMHTFTSQNYKPTPNLLQNYPLTPNFSKSHLAPQLLLNYKSTSNLSKITFFYHKTFSNFKMSPEIPKIAQCIFFFFFWSYAQCIFNSMFCQNKRFSSKIIKLLNDVFTCYRNLIFCVSCYFFLSFCMR